MFSALKPGSTVYVMIKDSRLNLYKGTVETLRGPATQFYALGAPMYLRVRLTGSKVEEFDNVPSNDTIVSYNGGDTIVSESEEQMLKELMRIRKSHQDIVDGYDYSKTIVKDCDESIKLVKPEYAKEQARDKELSEMRAEFNEMKNLMKQMLQGIAGNNSSVNQNVTPNKEE